MLKGSIRLLRRLRGKPAAAPAGTLGPDEAARRDDSLRRGLQLFELGRRAEAAEPLAIAAAADPTDLLLWRRLAWCRRGEENLDGEAVAWRQVLRIDPADDEARARLIEVLIEADRRAEAEPLLADLAQRRGDDIRLLVNLARARRELGDEPGALAAWRQVLAMNPAEPDANQNIGEALLAVGDIAAAADHLAVAAPAAAKPAPAWVRVAQLRRDVADQAGEIVALQRVIAEASAFHIKSRRRLIALLDATGRLPEAEPGLLTLIARHPSAALYKLLARARQARGDSKGEIEALHGLLALAPDDLDGRGRLAKHLLRAGNLTEGTAILRGLPHPVPSLWALAAKGCSAAGDVDGEIEAWRQVSAVLPEATPGGAQARARLAELLARG